MTEKSAGDREAAVAVAIKLEEDGRVFYLDAAAKTKSEFVRKTLESLAEDELRHIAWIKARLPGVDSSRDANRALYAKLEGIFAGAPAETRAAAAGAQSDSDAIDVAIGMEEKSAAVYAEWEEGGESEDLRKLGEILVGQERFHRQLLVNMKEYLASPGDWFMSEERWNFEGG